MVYCNLLVSKNVFWNALLCCNEITSHRFTLLSARSVFVSSKSQNNRGKKRVVLTLAVTLSNFGKLSFDNFGQKFSWQICNSVATELPVLLHKLKLMRVFCCAV